MIVNGHKIEPRADLRGARLSGAGLSGADLPLANLRGADLRGARLRGADLHYANLSDADLRGANLSNAHLRGANLSGVGLSGAELPHANLRGADLRGARLRGADLHYANLRYASLSYANLRGADLSNADLRDADLSGANLSGAKLPDFQIPQDGELTVWKAVCGGVAKLVIPASARRTAALMSRKCRAERARVAALYTADGKPYASGLHNEDTIYRVGHYVIPDSYDDDIRVECTHGIHFFLTREEAEEYR